jgi:hypothetical protein
MTRFKDASPFIAFGGKIDPISEVRNAGIVTSGDVYWVKDISDADYNSFKEAVGKENLFTSIQDAIDKCTDDQNDYVMVCPKNGGTAWELGTAIDLNKARVHLLSVGYTKATHGYTNTLQGYATATGMDDEIVHVTAEGCEIAGFRLLGTNGTCSNGTMDNGILYLSGSAHNLWVHDCSIETSGAEWDDEIPAGLVNSAALQHGVRFDDCFIGGTVQESAPGSQVLFVSSGGGRRWEVHDSVFLMHSINAGRKFVVAGTGDIEYLLLDRCKFLNLDQDVAVTSVVTGDVADDVGQVIMDHCVATNCTAFGTDDNCWVAPNLSGTVGEIANPGLALIGTSTAPETG